VAIECELGPDNPGTFDLTLTPRGQDPIRFPDLPFRGDDFRELHWLGFIGAAVTDSAFYLDNMRLGPVGGA
jgi:hypothetical protein